MLMLMFAPVFLGITRVIAAPSLAEHADLRYPSSRFDTSETVQLQLDPRDASSQASPDCATVRSMAETRTTQLNVTLENITSLLQDHSPSLTSDIFNTGSLALSVQSDINTVADVANGFADKLPDALDLGATRDNIGTVDLSTAIEQSANESTTVQDLLTRGEDQIKAWQVDARTALDACAAVANGTVVPQAKASDAGDSSTTLSNGSMGPSSTPLQSSMSSTNPSMASMSSADSLPVASLGWSSWFIGLAMLHAGVFLM